MWMLLGPSLMLALLDTCTFFPGLVPAGWRGKEDSPALDQRVVAGGDGFLLTVTSR